MPGGAVPPVVIRIEGIRASGRHGANPGERDVPQEFVVDVEAWVRSGTDTLQDTVDYRDIVDRARAVVETESHVLLETLATSVARSVKSLGGLTRVTAVVHKPGAARSLGVEDVSARGAVDDDV